MKIDSSWWALVLILVFVGCSTIKPLPPPPVDEIPKCVQVKAAGFFMKEGPRGVETNYVITFTPLKNWDKRVFFDVYFQNPEDRFHPIVLNKTIKLTNQEVTFTSSQVHGVRTQRDYLIDIFIYSDSGRGELLSHLQQNVRAAMDETTFREMTNPHKPQK